jgi:hypothetical protein
MPSLKTLVLVFGLAPVALAQNPGQNIRATVEINSVSSQSDTSGVSYVLTILPGSPEDFARFSVDVPGGVLRVLTPSNLWFGLTQFRGRPVAHWITADSLPGGSTTPVLHFDAVGLPGILTYWVGGDFQFPSLEEPDSIDLSDPIVSQMISGQTVGVEAWPASRSAQDLLARLRGLTQRTCDPPLTWITDSGLCSQLIGYLDQAETNRANGQISQAQSSLSDFMNAIAGSAPGTFATGVNSSAFWLLKANADIVNSSL